MSSFGSGSGWGGPGSRRSLQYDSHQNADLSTAYGSPPDHEKPEKKGSAFDWFHKMRQDHRERSDKRERAKSPPGSSSYLASPQSLRAPQDSPNGRGRSMDVPRPNADGNNEAVAPGSGSPRAAVLMKNTTSPTRGPAESRNEAQHPIGPEGVPQAGPPHAGQTQSTSPTAQGAMDSSLLQSSITSPVVDHPPTAAGISDSQPAAPRPTTPVQPHHQVGASWAGQDITPRTSPSKNAPAPSGA
jgi:hypothetical protein